MKPKILHLLDDPALGGISRWIEAISASPLSTQFEFRSTQSTTLSELLNTNRPDIILYHNPDPWKRARTLARLKRYPIKLIVQEHHYSEAFEQLNVESPFGFRTSLRLGYQLCDRVVAVSQGQASWMRKYKLVRSKKLITIPIETQLEFHLEMPRKQLQPPFTFGAYGRLAHQKGFDTLIQAMQQITTSEVQLYLGGFGEDETRLKTLAAHQPNIKFWGCVDDVQGFLSACDAIVIPSRWEPRGLVCSEAKAAGKPIVASKVDGLIEQVQTCGILVPPDDPRSLAAALDTIATASSTQLESWESAARTEVQNAWNQHLAQWESLIWTVLNQD